MNLLWVNLATFLSVYTLAIIVPGSNFAMVMNTALSSSRHSSVMAALGVATGSALFASAGLFGLIVMVNSIPYFPVVMGITGGGYLLYAGFVTLWSLRNSSFPEHVGDNPVVLTNPLTAYQSGLITNLTNPKAWAFYISLFTLTMTFDAPFWAKVVLGGAMFLISFAWYASIALLATHARIQPLLKSCLPATKGILGLLLIWLGGRLILG